MSTYGTSLRMTIGCLSGCPTNRACKYKLSYQFRILIPFFSKLQVVCNDSTLQLHNYITIYFSTVNFTKSCVNVKIKSNYNISCNKTNKILSPYCEFINDWRQSLDLLIGNLGVNLSKL